MLMISLMDEIQVTHGLLARLFLVSTKQLSILLFVPLTYKALEVFRKLDCYLKLSVYLKYGSNIFSIR